MAKQDINIGGFVNDPAADVVREAFRKAKENFTELYARSTGDMNKTVYDTTNSGVVDSAEKIEGVEGAGNRYYGTNDGVPGFFDLVIEATNIVFYTDAQPKPLEGIQNVIYIDKTNKKIEVWDGANYQVVAGSYNDTQLRADFVAADNDLALQIDAVEEDVIVLNGEVVKTISTNGGAPQAPVNGNVDLVVSVESAEVHTESVFNWSTGQSQIFTVADSAKTTDVYVNGSRLAKGATEEWNVSGTTGIEILIPLTDGDNIAIVSSATAAQDNTKIAKTANITALWTGTQAQYDAITTKDTTTLYFIQ